MTNLKIDVLLTRANKVFRRVRTVYTGEEGPGLGDVRLFPKIKIIRVPKKPKKELFRTLTSKGEGVRNVNKYFISLCNKLVNVGRRGRGGSKSCQRTL